MSRSLKLITILACVTLAVSACGKRGALEPPPGDDGKPVASSKQYGTKKDKQGYVHSTAPANTEHRPFVLDSLLR